MSNDLEIYDGDDDDEGGDDGDDFGGEQEEENPLEDDQDDPPPPEATPLSLVPVAQAEIALQDYKNLGPTRSITGLHNLYLSRLLKDPKSPVPTDSLYMLSQWEAAYNWKALSWEHDAESNRAFAVNRKTIMTKMYSSKGTRAETLLRIAEKSMAKIEADIDAGAVVLSPQDALKFLESGSKAEQEAREALLKLEDPNADSESGGTDFFDSIRKMGLLQINQINNYGKAG